MDIFSENWLLFLRYKCLFVVETLWSRFKWHITGQSQRVQLMPRLFTMYAINHHNSASILRVYCALSVTCLMQAGSRCVNTQLLHVEITLLLYTLNQSAKDETMMPALVLVQRVWGWCQAKTGTWMLSASQFPHHDHELQRSLLRHTDVTFTSLYGRGCYIKLHVEFSGCLILSVLLSSDYMSMTKM